MKRPTFAPRSMSLLVAAAGLVGCGSEKIDANVAYLSDGDVPAAATGTWLEIILAPDESIDENQEFRLRMDGRWVLSSPDDADYITFHGTTGLGKLADNLVSAAHIFQLVDSDGKVRLTTAPIDLTSGRANQVVVYGGKDKLDYVFFANSDGELASVPSGMVLARVMNLRRDRLSFPLRTCPAPSDPVAITNLADCTVVIDSFSYGQLWQAMIPRATNLGVTCDSTDILCNLQPLGRSCYVAPQHDSKTPAQITLLAVTAGNAFFPGNEFPIGDNCF